MIRRLPIRATTAVAIVFLAISGVAMGGAQATSFEPALPLGPVGQQPLTPVSQQNAVRKAQVYLAVMAFSRSGLINQLVQFEGFTPAQAAYGVATTGL